jgi:hypothetical protein
MEFRFSIRDDINVRSQSLIDLKYKDYNKEDISRAVAFYLDLILDSNYDKIAVGFGDISLLSVAFMLALHKSGKEYLVIHHDGTFNFDQYNHLFSHLFITGVVNPENTERVEKLNFFLKNYSNFILTDTKLNESAAFSYHKSDNLIFDYSKNKNISVIDNNHVKKLYTTEKIEGSSIDAAINNYFHEDDYVVIMRPFQHLGVGTLSIYPAFFKAKNISLCSNGTSWEEEYHNATHIHIDWNMMNVGCSLPKKLRMLTSGGYDFNSDCMEYVTSRSDIENIVDCFGTARCPPPLAIRKLKNNPDPHFVWVNDFIKPIVSRINTLSFDTEEKSFDRFNKIHIQTNDVVEFIDNSYNFRIVNRLVSTIRMEHKLYPVEVFKKLFKEYSKISDFEVDYEVVDGLKSPVVVVNEQDSDIAYITFIKFYIEAKLRIRK